MSSSQLKLLLLGVGASAALGIALAAVPVWAHTKLVSMLPPAGSVVAPGPMDITLTFDAPVAAAQCKLVDKDGKLISTAGPAYAEGAVVHFPVTARLPDGRYSLGYKVAGDDAQAKAGAYDVGAYDFWVQAVR